MRLLLTMLLYLAMLLPLTTLLSLLMVLLFTAHLSLTTILPLTMRLAAQQSYSTLLRLTGSCALTNTMRWVLFVLWFYFAFRRSGRQGSPANIFSAVHLCVFIVDWFSCYICMIWFCCPWPLLNFWWCSHASPGRAAGQWVHAVQGGTPACI